MTLPRCHTVCSTRTPTSFGVKTIRAFYPVETLFVTVQVTDGVVQKVDLLVMFAIGLVKAIFH